MSRKQSGAALSAKLFSRPALVEPLDPFTEADTETDGAAILDRARTFIARFCAFPDAHCLNAVVLWAAHTHAAIAFETTPRLALLSPEPGSGKTRALEILDLIGSEPMHCLSASPAAIFRTLQARSVTLLFDEVDAVFQRRGTADANEDLRALLNAGYRRGASIPRCVGPRHDVEHFPVFAPVALAGLGDLPDTLMSRSVIVRMRRRAPEEHVEPFRRRDHAEEGQAIAGALADWCADVAPALAEARPALPEGVTDRAADVWEPLISIADAAGGAWPGMARAACRALVEAAKDRKQSLGVRLLGDLRVIFADSIALPTKDILARLKSPDENGLEADAPWAELGGVGLTDRKLAALLKSYGVPARKVKVHGVALQGFRREDLEDPFRRYLPHTPKETELTEPPELTAEKVLQVPRVPFPIGSEGRCPRCDGAGCAWCNSTNRGDQDAHLR
jgi:hypothetical protein